MRRLVLGIAGVLLLVVPVRVNAGDLEDLKTAAEAERKALSSLQVEPIMAIFHDRAIGFWGYDPLPTDLAQMDKAAQRKAWEDWLPNVERWILTPINVQYRVIGDTGIVCGLTKEVIKFKDGPQKTLYWRFTDTYTKSSGKWLLLVWHGSPVQTGGE
jgi:ketosteroid isomerase-like protein